MTQNDPSYSGMAQRYSVASGSLDSESFWVFTSDVYRVVSYRGFYKIK
jgi:hypothetical protein